MSVFILEKQHATTTTVLYNIWLVYSGETRSDLFLEIIADSTSHLILLKVKRFGCNRQSVSVSMAIKSNVCRCFST